ncbi:MAG: DUF4430 domain-containing protein [candidate division Zixibacteria bacterium]|nr:DUF4430 domain-containing protein [candidate division Zixibacteria bacterium]
MIKHGFRLFVVAVLAFLAMSCGSRDQEPQQKLSQGGHPGHGILIVAFAPDSADTFGSVGTDSILVLDWLRQACDSAEVMLAVKTFPFGTLVDAIGPRRNGEGGNWLYKVNGKMVPKAASSHVVSSNDTVDFFYH